MKLVQFLKIFIISTTLLASTVSLACRQTQITRSTKLLDFILKDVQKSYNQPGGGGISQIKMISTDVYKVSIPKEMRIEEITYHLTIDRNCVVTLVKRKNSTKTMGPANKSK